MADELAVVVGICGRENQIEDGAGSLCGCRGGADVPPHG